MQPDILVARRVDYTDRDLPTAPLLAVEVLSPSTRLIDLNLKKARYEIAGCASSPPPLTRSRSLSPSWCADVSPS